MIGLALYLHLRALGLRIELMRQPEHPDGCVLRLHGVEYLETGDGERCKRLIRTNKPALVALLASGSPSALAVRQEGGCDSNGRSREAA